MDKEIKKKQLKEVAIIGSSIATLFLILISIFIFAKNYINTPLEVKTTDSENKNLEEGDVFSNPFDKVKISASGAYVKDINSGEILYQKNYDKQLPLASITKVVTAITASEILGESDLIKINGLDLGNENLIYNEHFRIKDLINLTLVSSSNGGAQILADSANQKLLQSGSDKNFIDYMNDFISKIGMKNTLFRNATGLDENNETEAGATGSAKDVATLFEYVLKNKPNILEATKLNSLAIKSKEGFEYRFINTNEITSSLPNIIGSKTGYTEIAGGNLAVIIDPALNNPIIIVVLGSSKEGRFKDVDRLARATLDYFLIK